MTATSTATPKPRRARVPRYRDSDGNYLAAMEVRGKWALAWYLPEDREFGSEINSSSGDTVESKAVCHALREFCSAHDLVLPRASCVYVFGSERLAYDALRHINTALCAASADNPLPEWAQKALAAGWTPPKGWKP